MDYLDEEVTKYRKKKKKAFAKKANHKHEYIDVALTIRGKSYYSLDGKFRHGYNVLLPARVCSKCGRIENITFFSSTNNTRDLSILPHYECKEFTSKSATPLNDESIV